MSYPVLRRRLYEGRPLILGSDVGAALRNRGLNVGAPGALGAVLHKNPEQVAAHHRDEVLSRVDVLCALTSDTSPRSLAEMGMEHRAARLTASAVEIAQEVAATAHRPVAVAAVLGNDQVTATHKGRFEDELGEHARRIAAAGAEVVLVRGMASRLDLVFGVAAAAGQELPVWAVIDGNLATNEGLPDLLNSVADAGAEGVLFEVVDADEGMARLDAFYAHDCGLMPGALVSAAPDSLRGFPGPMLPGWVESLIALTAAGARVIGGGAGTTELHTRALAASLGKLHPSMPPTRAGDPFL